MFVACEKETAKPVVDILEVGMNNSKTVVAGNELHVEASIVAEGKIDNIRVMIHTEEEGEDHDHVQAMKVAAASAHEGEWEVDSVYTGMYVNLKSTTFHEHIDVPDETEPGIYHLHLYVTDLEGNQTMDEEEFEVQAAN